MVSIAYTPTHTVHAVYASGDPEDGSLYGFVTLCNREIKQIERWQEPGGTVTCGNCKRVIRANALTKEREA